MGVFANGLPFPPGTCPSSRGPVDADPPRDMWPWHPFGPDLEAEVRGSEYILMAQSDDYFDCYRPLVLHRDEIPRWDNFCNSDPGIGQGCQATDKAQDRAPGRPPPKERPFPTGTPAPQPPVRVNVPTWLDLGLT